MKKILILFLLAVVSLNVYSQCPTCPVGSTIITIPTALTNITIASGTSTCLVGTGSYTGNISLNGGTLSVGVGIDYNPGSQNFSGTNVINNCGTLSKTFNANNLTINNYANNVSVSYVIDNGVKFNNYATGVTLNVNNGNPNNPVNITNSVNSSITVITNTNNTNCSSSLGSSTNITNDGTMTFPNSLCVKGGLITNNKNLTFSNQFAMDGGTLESKNGSNTSINILRKNNGNINVYNGSILSLANIINYDGPSIKMMDPGCSYVTLATPPSSSFNSNLTDNGTNVWPNGINYCGGVPRNSASSGNTISSVVNSFGTYRITLTNGTNAPNNGDYVYITGVVGGTLNGYWKVNKISNYVYDLVSSAYSPITSLSSNFIYTNNLRFGNATYMGETGCSNPCVPLPVVFTFFNVNKIDGNTCNISVGINVSYDECILQSSTDGKNFIDVSINTNKSSVVDFTTYSLSSTIYYRIKCISGNEIYYSQLKVNQNNDYTHVEIYPNLTNDGIVNITWNHLDINDINSDITLTIFDINGNIVRNYNLIDYKDNNFLMLNLPKGIFLFKIYGNNIYKTFKVVSI